MKRYFFVYSENLESINVFGDLKGRDDVVLHIAHSIVPAGRFKKFIYRLHMNRHMKLPFQFVWYDKNIGGRDMRHGDCLIIESGALRVYPIVYLEKLAKRRGLSVSLLLLNSMKAESPNLKKVKECVSSSLWKRVYTFDREDARSYGWSFIGLNYFSRPKRNIDAKKSFTAYFTGGLKGNRSGLILRTFEKLYNSNVDCVFDIYCYSHEQYMSRVYPEKINYFCTWKPYEEIQDNVISAECIIEILQEGQNTQSIRYFEAVYYNKKLLTNNPNIVDLPYYDPRFMRYFKDAEDIDIEWLCKEMKVNYHYQGDFTPLNLLMQLKTDNSIFV